MASFEDFSLACQENKPKGSFSGSSNRKKMYRGVRQRHGEKWVAEIRVPQSRMRAWLGTYDSAEAAAYAYDRAAYKLTGEYARLNLKDPAKLGVGDSAKMDAIRVAVDTKIHAICLKREKASKNARKKQQVATLSSSSSSSTATTSSSQAVSEEMLLSNYNPEELLEYDGTYPLARMPSYDPDLISQVLAN